MSRILNEIKEKVFSGVRLDRDECMYLGNSNDIPALGKMADFVRKNKIGNNAFFSQNLNINYTNICELMCPLCAFSKEKEDKESYILSLDDIELKVRSLYEKGLFEVHIVGGLSPDIPFSYFIDMLSRIKDVDRGIHVQAFTAVEIDYFSRIYSMDIKDVLLELRNAGLGSMPGGGAEIFSGRIREKICPDKISGDRWLEVMETAHSMGIQTNATMLYGHYETFKERIDHMLALRDLQDKTNGFLAFVPLAFHPENTKIESIPYGTTGIDDIKMISISRIVLDNVPHIKALWMYSGMKMAETMLFFGADDIGGISLEEKIVHAAGAKTARSGDKKDMIRIIENAGRIPIECDSVYRKRHAQSEPVTLKV